MKLKILDWIHYINDDESPIEVIRDNNRHVDYINVADVRRSLKDLRKQIVIKANGKRYGFNRQYIVDFLNRYEINDGLKYDLKERQKWLFYRNLRNKLR